MKSLFIALGVLAATFSPFTYKDVASLAPNIIQLDQYSTYSEAHLVEDIPITNAGGVLQAVVEIPTGTSGKWEIIENGNLEWEFKKAEPRIVNYLPYPGNYGSVPQTLGGDGDPIDVIILGQAVARGEVVGFTPIGLMEMIDGGEEDYKIIATMANSPLAHINSLVQLEEEYPGVKDIIEIWFSNYKGIGADVVIGGWQDQSGAVDYIQAAYQKFSNK